ncbi:MAG: DUF393 domain-containing protein [Saprospiraceae bacterium]|nr:DUF393 domain-containing protein [Saprospiraceae bacterium]
MPGSFRVLLRDSFLIGSFIFVTYLLLFKSRVLFATTFNHDNKDIIRFDGVCNLCNSFVQFVLKRDIDQVFRFGTLQSRESDVVEYNTVEVHSGGETLEHSAAFLSVVRRLKGFWPYLYLTVIIPKQIRDLIYHWVARNRYRWFGKQESCMIPSSDVSDRFVE